MKKLSLRCLCAVAAAGAFFWFGVPAMAQDKQDKDKDKDTFTLEEVTVTAEKRAENLQKTPISISVIQGTTIQNDGSTSITNILKDIPNVSTSNMGTSGGYTINIRGLGMDLPPGMGESSVSVNFDDSNDARTESSLFGYFDVQRIEVLRGPQGTLYGRNATGGVLNVVSEKPTTDRVKGYAALEYGNYAKKKAEAAVNIPISDTVAGRVAFVTTQVDGYTADDHGYRADQSGLATRIQLRYMPTEDVSFNLLYNYSKTHAGNFFIEVPKSNWDAGKYDLNDAVWPYDTTVKFMNKSQKVSLKAEFPLGVGIMTVIPTYANAKGTSTSFGLPPGPPSPNPTPRYNADNRPFNYEAKIGELRYSNKSDSKVKWQVGLYYLKSTDPIDPVGAAAKMEMGRGGADLYTDTKAVFGQVTYPVTDTFRAIAGLRYSEDKKGYENAFNFLYTEHSYSFSYTDYKFGIEKDLSPDIMSYLTLASGHKPGGFDDQTAAPFDMESNVSGELGLKSRFLDQRLQVNADVFYYQYKGYQVVDAYMAYDPAIGQDNMFVRFFNAPKARSQGGEIATTALIGDATLVNLDLTYLKNEYSEDFFMHPDVMLPAINLKGETMPHSPEFSVMASIDHTFSLGDGSTLRPKVSYRWKDKQYLGYLTVPSNLGPAFQVVDFTMNYVAAKGWSLNFYANNVLDEHYYEGSVQHGNDTMIFPADPRTIGTTLNVRF